MDRDSVDWRGYWVAAPTPYADEEALDTDALRALMDQYVDAGVHGLLINGSTGEWWAQSPEERRRVAEVAIAAVDRRIPVVVGCSAFTPTEVIELARHAAAAGADGVLATPPPYVHPTQDEIVAFYERIDAEVDLPLMIYNWPRGTSVAISVDTAIRIAELDHVVAIKDSTSDFVRVVDCLEALTGTVRIFTWLVSPRGLGILRELGGDGFIDGGGLGAPFAVPFFEALQAGDLDEARAWAARFAGLMTSLVSPDFSGRFGSWSAQLKAAMALLGQPGGVVRSPLLPVGDLGGLRSVLNDAGLLDGAVEAVL